MRRLALLAVVALTAAGCGAPAQKPDQGKFSTWYTSTDPETGRSFRCRSNAGWHGAGWCYEMNGGRQ